MVDMSQCRDNTNILRIRSLHDGRNKDVNDSDVAVYSLLGPIHFLIGKAMLRHFVRSSDGKNDFRKTS